MKPFIVTYDLHKQGQNYTDLIAKLKTYGTHSHVQGSVWIVSSSKTAAQIRDDLQSALDANDKLIVARLQGEAAWYGYTDQIATWMKSQLLNAA